MAAQSKIEWTDSTFNPWIGCTKVGPGCDHCYAERDWDLRRHRVTWGAGNARSRTSVAAWKQPIRWNQVAFAECPGCGWRGEEGDCHAGDLGPACPTCGNDEMRRARRRVFCASLADVFDNEVDPAWRADLFALIRNTPNLDWLLLTKRVGNVRSMVEACGGWSENAGLGLTIVNQDELNRDGGKIVALRHRFRLLFLFASCEPLLSALDFSRVPDPGSGLECSLDLLAGKRYARCNPEAEWFIDKQISPRFDWIIAGGESGPKARPFDLRWARSLRDQCSAAGVPFLWKQHGEWFPAAPEQPKPEVTRCKEWHGGFTSWWTGKKTAGRLLDGVEHNGFPQSA